MYDMKPLEEEWLKYQKKKRKPLYIFFLFFVITVLVIVFLLTKNDVKIDIFEKYLHNLDTVTNKNILSTKNNKNKFILTNEALKRLEIVEIDTSKSTNNVAKQSISSRSMDVLVDIPILDQEGENIVSQSEDIDRKKVYLNIIESSSLSAYADVEKRFHQSHDIDDALFLAKSYYKKENYKKAEQWAFEANKMDGTLEESFLIFVKAKIKLGQINEAKSLLNQYLNHSESKDVRGLLNKIENNEL